MNKKKMPDRFLHRFLPASGSARYLTAAIAAVLILTCCTDAASNFADEYLIRVGDRTVTVSDFNKAFESAKSAYPQNLSQNSALLKEAQILLLNQLIEEQLLLERATELKIELSESEVERAIADIKKDYPEGVFEQMLIEHAVSRGFWEERLRSRLIMERVIALELEQNMAITPEEIAAFYKETYQGQGPVSMPDEEKRNDDELLVAQLRRKKTEDAYRLWMEKMRRTYPVDVNRARWERLSGSSK